MAEPKWFDINKIENFLKNSADKAQSLSYWKAAVDHGNKVANKEDYVAACQELLQKKADIETKN